MTTNPRDLHEQGADLVRNEFTQRVDLGGEAPCMLHLLDDTGDVAEADGDGSGVDGPGVDGPGVDGGVSPAG